MRSEKAAIGHFDLATFDLLIVMKNFTRSKPREVSKKVEEFGHSWKELN